MKRFADGVVEQIREEGSALVPGAVGGGELAAARAEAASVMPSIVEFEERTGDLPALRETHDPIDAYHVTCEGNRLAAWQRHAIHVGMPALFGLATAPAALDLAARVFGDVPVVDSYSLSGKYARGRRLFEQGFHIDPLYAVYARRTTPSIRMWVYLTDVSAGHGPTEVIVFNASDDDDLTYFSAPGPDFSGYYYLHEHPELSGRVRRAEAEAGSVLVYQARTHHRATAFDYPSGCRWIAAYSYRAASRNWMATSWDLTRIPGGRIRPNFAALTVAQRTALGFPPSGDPYWNDKLAIAEVERILPGIDLTPYRVAAMNETSHC